MAAAYLFHIARNHPFVDGKKRTALMTALVFPGLNGYRLEADPGELFDRVVGAAEGLTSKSEFATSFREFARKRPG
jgi:death-on-curing protein